MAAYNLRTCEEYSIQSYNALIGTVDANGNLNTGLTSTVRQIAGTQTTFLGFILHNNAATRHWVQVFFRPANQVVLGTTAPDFTIAVGASGDVAWDFYHPIRQGTGLSLACTTTEIGTTTATTAMTGSIYYK